MNSILLPRDVVQHSDLMTDPINRFYRYPVARAISPTLVKWGLSPNQITGIHSVLGLVTAGVLFDEHYLLAVLMYEVRAILDCADGVVARLTGKSSPFGRTMDAVGDAVSFLGLMTALLLLQVQKGSGWQNPILLFIAVGLMSALAGTFHDVLKRFIVSVLKAEPNDVELQWRQQTGLGKLIDSLAIRTFAPQFFARAKKRRYLNPKEFDEVSRLEQQHLAQHWLSRGSLLYAVEWGTSAICGDNGLALISLGLLAAGLGFDVHFGQVLMAVVVYFLAIGLVTLFLFRVLVGEQVFPKLHGEPLARSVAVGVAGALSPFPGVQTPFLVVLAFFTRTSLPVIYAVSWINNPVTMVPIALAEYRLGTFFFEGADSAMEQVLAWAQRDPSWNSLPWNQIGFILKPFLSGACLAMVVGFTLTYSLMLLRERRRR